MMNFYDCYNKPLQLNKSELINLFPMLVNFRDPNGNFGPSDKDRLQPVLPMIKQSPYLCFKYAEKIMLERWDEAEKVILNTPKQRDFVYIQDDTSYYMSIPNVAASYAMDVMHKRWLEAEPLIKTATMYSAYCFSFDILDDHLETEKRLNNVIVGTA
jgi:hypothetical protein